MRTLAAFAVSILLLQGCSLLTIDLQPRIQPLEEETVEGKGKAKILLMDVSGVLSDETGGLVLGSPPPRVPIVARVREELQKAEEDDNVKALIVRINSPGGTITASDLIYREIDTFKTRRKIPVIAVTMDVAASGGYYAALAADTIVALPTSVTGSIGVIMLTVNAKGLMEKIGVAPLAIKSGEMKDAGSPFRPLTAEERAVFQSVIDQMYGRFVTLIARSRKIPEDRVRTFADGRIYTAEQAKALGLVDEIGYMDDVVKVARKAAGVEEARVIMYQRPKDYRANFYSAAPAPVPGLESSLQQLTALVSGSGPRFLYLWWP
ncbi:MAG: signal peptide peptidase SppA [Candidatus Rokubacteria bacterium]|nr:signal peptide peptidase SppA [Candidatus Rokubacteria bacterium]